MLPFPSRIHKRRESREQALKWLYQTAPGTHWNPSEISLGDQQELTESRLLRAYSRHWGDEVVSLPVPRENKVSQVQKSLTTQKALDCYSEAQRYRDSKHWECRTASMLKDNIGMRPKQVQSWPWNSSGQKRWAPEPHKQQSSSWDWLTKASNLLLLQGRPSHCQACQNPHPSRSLHKLLAVAKVLETALAKCLSHKLYPHRQLPLWNIHMKTAHGTGSGRLNQSFKEFIEQN